MQQENQNHGRDQNIFNQPGMVVVNPQAERLRDPVQRKLLEVMRGEVSDRLAQSLHRVVGASLINLTKESQPGKVRSPWQMELWQEQQPPQRLPPETTIAQVFDQAEVERKLLILGEPGSGKTTTMLELARELVQRAEANVDQPIPVLLNLSSWKPPQDGKQDPFLPWLLAELKAKYGIQQDLSKTWLARSQLMPLLDGLDEVAPQHQEACATAINQWLTVDVEQRPMGLVVCCRIKEYEEVVRKRLYLEGAIALLPLTDDQIQIYLAQLGLEQIWHIAQTSETLQDLLSKPLFLSIFGFVASQKRFEVAEWQSFQREYLLDQYWEVAMKRELVSLKEREEGKVYSKTYGKRSLPEPECVKRTLIFIAKGLTNEPTEDLLIENIQPYWLTSEEHIKAYRFLYLLMMAPITLLAILLITIFVGKYIIFLFSFFLPFLSIDYINPIQRVRFSEFLTSVRMSNLFSHETIRSTANTGVLFRLFAYSLAVLVFLSSQLNIPFLTYGLVIGVMGILGNFIVRLFITAFEGKIEVHLRANQSIKDTFKNIVLLSLIIVPFCSLLGYSLLWRLSAFAEITFKQQIYIAFIIYTLWLIFLGGGGKALIQHIALRLVTWWNGYAPFRYDRLLNYATERLLLQRIGGRYRFMHKLLQEHFAAMDLDA